MEPTSLNKSAVDIAISKIGEYIITYLQVGDLLPSEREIAEKLKISRNITREALQHYRTLGIIESKPKIGAFVARLTPLKAFDGYHPFLAIMDHGLEDLVQLRLMLELGVAEVAIEKVSSFDLEELQNLCQKMKTLSEKDYTNNSILKEELFFTDLEFHSKMLKLSNNTLIESLIPLVVEFFSKCYLNYFPNTKRLTGYEEHFLMVEALQEKDAKKLQQLLRNHINEYSKNIQSKSTSKKK
jgi:GntR family transcriptional repressor for pyruvate dehydrogenase complex